MTWASSFKRLSQTAAFVFAVFFAPIPVPIQLAAWSRVVIAIAIVVSLPLLRLVHSRRWPVWITLGAILLIAGGIALGVRYWLALPERTIEVRGGLYVNGTETEETRRQREALKVDLVPYVAGLPNRPVDSFFEPQSIRANSTYLAAHYILFLTCVTVGVMILLEWIPGTTSAGASGHERSS